MYVNCALMGSDIIPDERYRGESIVVEAATRGGMGWWVVRKGNGSLRSGGYALGLARMSRCHWTVAKFTRLHEICKQIVHTRGYAD